MLICHLEAATATQLKSRTRFRNRYNPAEGLGRSDYEVRRIKQLLATIACLPYSGEFGSVPSTWSSYADISMVCWRCQTIKWHEEHVREYFQSVRCVPSA